MCTVFSHLETRNTHSPHTKADSEFKVSISGWTRMLVPFHPLQKIRTSAIPTVPSDQVLKPNYWFGWVHGYVQYTAGLTLLKGERKSSCAHGVKLTNTTCFSILGIVPPGMRCEETELWSQAVRRLQVPLQLSPPWSFYLYIQTGSFTTLSVC